MITFKTRYLGHHSLLRTIDVLSTKSICILTVFLFSFFFSLSPLLFLTNTDVILPTTTTLTFFANLYYASILGTFELTFTKPPWGVQETADCIALQAFSSALVKGPTTGNGSNGRNSTSSASKFQQNHYNYNTNTMGSSQFRSSSSQTTFLDRNIVQNLAVESGVAPVNTSSSKLSSVGGRTTTTVATGGGYPRRRRPKTVPASYTSGSGSVKRASFSGTLPDGNYLLLFISFFIFDA